MRAAVDSAGARLTRICCAGFTGGPWPSAAQLLLIRKAAAEVYPVACRPVRNVKEAISACLVTNAVVETDGRPGDARYPFLLRSRFASLIDVFQLFPSSESGLHNEDVGVINGTARCPGS